MIDKQEFERLFRDHGFDDFRWLPAAQIVVAQWVRMKCIYGCPEYGLTMTCPPNTPSVTECERFIREYSEAAIFHFTRTAPSVKAQRGWSREVNGRLLDLERAVFLGHHYKAFMLLMGSCPRCEECVGRWEDCRQPGSARPTPEGMAIDLFATARSVGYPLDVLEDYSRPMNRYAILLIE